MLVPFQRETLLQERFLKDEVQFNLLYRISEGECATALQAEDGGAVALQSSGRALWLWVDRDMGDAYVSNVTHELAGRLKDTILPGVTAQPEVACRFIRAYCGDSAVKPELETHLMAYQCPAVQPPHGVPGGIVKAEEAHLETVADFRAGFIKDIFGQDNDRKSMLKDAEILIKTAGLFLWIVDGNAVGMTAIGHRSPRHARINNVYTVPEERGKGYASALVACVSRIVLSGGLTPMLYANLDYPPSNKVYRGIGYIEAGAVDEYRFTFE